MIKLIREHEQDAGQAEGPLYLLGPTFSGSLFSLAVALEENKSQLNNFGVTVFSGTITSDHNQKWFLKWNADHCEIPVRFASFQADDDSLIESFKEFAVRRGYTPGEIAVLSEDETDFGAGLDTASSSGGRGQTEQGANRDDDTLGSIVRLHFPREISQLRAAYQSILPSSNSDASGRVLLPLDLQTSGSDDDGVPDFGKQTPLSQEAVMLGISTDLHKHHTKLVLMFATDPMDQLFVAQYLRRAYPPARVGITSPDLLFAREGDTLLQGTFGVAAYSLAPGAEAGLLRAEGNRLTSPREVPRGRKEEHVFASALTQGLYNATVGLLAAISESQTSRSATDLTVPFAPYVSYGSPAELNLQDRRGSGLSPVVQITILARDGYWELASLPPVSSAKESRTALLPQDATAMVPFLVGQHIPMSLDVAALLIALVGLTHLGFSLSSTVLSRWEAQAQFAFVKGAQKPSSRERLLVIGSIIVTIAFMLQWTARVAATKRSDSCGELIIEMAMAVAAVIFGVLTTYDFGIRRGSLSCATVYLAVFSFIFLGAVVLGHFRPDPLNWLWSSRSLHLTSGCSPLLSILLLLSGGYWWMWYGLRGMVLTDEHRPRLPSRDDSPPTSSAFGMKMERNSFSRRMHKLIYGTTIM